MLAVAAALCLAAFTQGLTGFGFGMVAVALLPLLVGLHDAQIIIAIMAGVVCAAAFAGTWRHFRLREGIWLVIGAAVGVPIGLWALFRFPAWVLLRSLGLLLCLFAASQLRAGNGKRIRIPHRLGFPIGIISGCLGGALNIGGPPAIAYAYSQPWRIEQTVSFLQAVFGISAAIRLALLIPSQMIHRQHILVSSLSLLPMVLATWTGSRLLRRVPQQKVRRFVFLFLFVMGVKYLIA